MTVKHIEMQNSFTFGILGSLPYTKKHFALVFGGDGSECLMSFVMTRVSAHSEAAECAFFC